VVALCQGRIVRAAVLDPRGANRKIRPLVILTSDDEIDREEILVGVAVTSQFSNPLDNDEVALPWSANGLAMTQLRKPSVAKCSWLCVVEKSESVELKGIVRRDELTRIKAITASL
jgi:PemK-like, MazF-like toxin of type II toxin-antitoxin system